MSSAGNAMLLAALACLAACASEVVRHPAELTQVEAAQARRYTLERPAPVMLDSGYQRVIAAGTELVESGSLGQGRVLRPVNTVFTVEGAHMHEAYLVVDGRRLVGFYLPVEKSFAPLSQSAELPLQERGSAK